MATLTNIGGNTATLSNVAQHSASLANSSLHFYNQSLLLENGGYLLTEDGFRMILEQSIPVGETLTNITLD
jgi:hypothetical protein